MSNTNLSPEEKVRRKRNIVIMVLGVIVFSILLGATLSYGPFEDVQATDSSEEEATARASVTQSWTEPVEVSVNYLMSGNADHLRIESSTGDTRYIESEGTSITYAETDLQVDDTLTIYAVNEKDGENVETKILTYTVDEPFLSSL